MVLPAIFLRMRRVRRHSMPSSIAAATAMPSIMPSAKPSMNMPQHFTRIRLKMILRPSTANMMKNGVRVSPAPRSAAFTAKMIPENTATQQPTCMYVSATSCAYALRFSTVDTKKSAVTDMRTADNIPAIKPNTAAWLAA